MKTYIETVAAPKAIGPYSQGTSGAGFVFTSGQLPINGATGAIPEGISAQTRQSLENVRAVLEAGGTNMDSVLKTTVFLKNIDDFAEMNKIYSEFFSEGRFPSRSAVEVSALPKNALVEIEAVAVKLNKL